MLFGKFKIAKDEEGAIAFVDYEHWYYSYHNIYNMKPNVRDWYDEIVSEYQVKELFFFGDFKEYGMSCELGKLKEFNSHIVNTTNTKEGANKDFTDFIMLDYIYQKAVEERCPDTFVIFTGDGHFDSVIKYLRNKLHKKVITYGVKRAFSGKLKSASSSYVEMPRYIQEQQYYIELILKTLRFIENKPQKQATYWKTVKNVAEHNGLSEERIQVALDDLMNQKYIAEHEVNVYNGKMRVLNVDWLKLEKDGVWKKEFVS